MAFIEDITKATTPAGLAVGVGAALVAPALMPAVSGVLRPSVKALMRTGITLYRGLMEPISAGISSLVSEAQLELATASTTSAPAAKPEPEEPPHKTRQSKHRGGAQQH